MQVMWVIKGITYYVLGVTLVTIVGFAIVAPVAYFLDKYLFGKNNFSTSETYNISPFFEGID